MRVTNRIRISLLAAWLGMASYFSVVVAPNVFGVLRSFGIPNASEVAGTIVTRTLSAVNKSGLLLSLLLLVITLGVRKLYGRMSLILQNLLLIVVTISTAVGEWVIARRMRGLRAAMHGQIDQVPLDDPNRMAFAALHGYSVAALSVAMIAALVVVLLLVFSSERVVESTSE